MRAKMVSYFVDKLGVVPHNTGWLRQGLCPQCSKDKKFGINLFLNRTNCFSCGYHPVPLYLVMKLENLDTYTQVFKFLDAFEGAEYLEIAMPVLEEKKVKLPESFRLLSFGEGSVARMARNYMKKRGYSIDKLTMKGVGYCTKGEYAYRIIIPFYAQGKIIYFNARQFIEVGSKHKNPPITEFGIGKNLIIYNVDALSVYEKIYMVESATNALTLGDNACAFGGKLASVYQLSKVIQSPVKYVVILWDPDAYWEALKMALQLVPYKKVKVVKLPMKYKGKSKPDVNDLGRKKTLEFVKKYTYMNYSQLFNLYIQEPIPIYHLPEA